MRASSRHRGFWCCRLSVIAATTRWQRLLFESTIGELQAMQVLVLGSRSARAVADDEPLDSARRVNAQAVLSSRLVRQAEGTSKAGTLRDALHVHTMLLSAPYGQMLASRRYSRAADDPRQHSSSR